MFIYFYTKLWVFFSILYCTQKSKVIQSGEHGYLLSFWVLPPTSPYLIYQLNDFTLLQCLRSSDLTNFDFIFEGGVQTDTNNFIKYRTFEGKNKAAIEFYRGGFRSRMAVPSAGHITLRLDVLCSVQKTFLPLQ